MKNEKVRLALLRNDITQQTLAKVMNVSPIRLSNVLAYELAPEEQDRMLELIDEIIRKREESKCDGNANA